jgi:hypothetical protein
MSEEIIGISTSTTITIIKETIDTNTFVKLTPMLLNGKNYLTFLSSINQEQEPNSYLKAQQNPIWCKTMKEELKALEKNKT